MLSLFLLMRKTIQFSITDIAAFRSKCMLWALKFEHFILLDSNNHSTKNNQNFIPSTFDMLIAADSLEYMAPDSSLADLKAFIGSVADWSFGHLGFNLQSETEGVFSKKINSSGFPNVFFFQPKWVVMVKNNSAELFYPEFISENDAYSELKYIHELLESNLLMNNRAPVQCRCTKEQYIRDVKQLQEHIALGNIYEINYCVEFYANNCKINPYNTYLVLQSYSPAPFSAFYKFNDKFLLCSSPERFLKKEGRTIISQPIKGTISRGESHDDDEANRFELANNLKERSENIMIADLVRNDLSKVAVLGSVNVDELCGVYTYKYVHQLITTISAELDSNSDPVDAIFNTFPMGSMTGAPKFAALKLIERYEHFNRGLFSGSVGYFNPLGDFDFNVVIRSILYNDSINYLSIPAGSAITANSVPESEYNECLLKANALIQLVK
jgi:para-aminobenzoate synthetase component 1